MDITNIDRVPAFITKDGSQIRELLSHRNSCIRRQSLAEARVPWAEPRRPTFILRRKRSTTSWKGVGQCRWTTRRLRSVAETGCDSARHRHQIRNTDSVVLKFLCCCAPAYEDDDTVLETV